jgi:hypothetical protein
MTATHKGKPDDSGDHSHEPGGEVTFTVHDEDDGETGTFTVKRGSSLADAITKAYEAVKRSPTDGDQIKADGTGEAITAGAHETVAAYLAHGGTLVWLISGPTGGAHQ